MGSTSIQMERLLKACGKIIICMVRVFILMLMEVNTLVNSSITTEKVKVYCKEAMVKYMMGCGKTI